MCVAYQHTFNARVVDVISEWGSLYVLLKDGRVSKYVIDQSYFMISLSLSLSLSLSPLPPSTS